MPNRSNLLSITASLRNDDQFVKVSRAVLLLDEFRTYARYNNATRCFDTITTFIQHHNRDEHTVIRSTSSAFPVAKVLETTLRDAAPSIQDIVDDDETLV